MPTFGRRASDRDVHKAVREHYRLHPREFDSVSKYQLPTSAGPLERRRTQVNAAIASALLAFTSTMSARSLYLERCLRLRVERDAPNEPSFVTGYC